MVNILLPNSKFSFKQEFLYFLLVIFQNICYYVNHFRAILLVLLLFKLCDDKFHLKCLKQ